MVEELLAHNRRWAAGQVAADPDYFMRLSALQAPEYLWIGCSDSRVPANVITGLEPGEVFVHRNVANIVHTDDLNFLSVLQFAVDALKVRHIIVCGHYGCGGVRAAISGEDLGILEHWLSPIREIAEGAGAELKRLEGESRLDRLCELSVVQQVARVVKTPIVRRAWSRGQILAVHGWVYGLRDGLLRDLGCRQSGPS